MKQLHVELRKILLGTALLIFFTCSFSVYSFAQTFIAPVAFEDSYPPPGSPNIGLTAHTSAYSWSTLNVAGTTFDIVLAGWDDASGNPAGMSWRYMVPSNPGTIINQGIVPYTNVRDVEVGLLQSGVGPEILVAYYLNGVGHFVDVYTVTLGGPVYAYTNTLSTMTNYTRISMDCHLLYATAITWQDAQSINTVVGLAGGGGITFSGILSLQNTQTETIPDCAFSHTPMAGTLNVHYAYYDPNSGNITESSYDFWIMIWMMGGMVPVAVNDVNFVGPLPNEEVLNIDCPGHYNVENWAYTYTNNQQDISVRFVDFNTSGTPTTVIVNNGSLGNVAINTSRNVHPFCAYDKNHTPGAASFQVGWHTYAIDPATGAQAGYVSTQVNESGTVQINPILPMFDYQTVANNPTWASQTPVLSFSKQDDQFPYLYTVFPEWDQMMGAFRLENKYHKWSAPQFKGQEHNPFTCGDEAKIREFEAKHIAASRFTAYPNPFSNMLGITVPASMQHDNADITVTDITGKASGKYSGPLSKANAYLSELSKTLATNTYLVNINVAGKTKETLKVVKAE